MLQCSRLHTIAEKVIWNLGDKNGSVTNFRCFGIWNAPLQQDKQINYAFDEGIEQIDWSKAGNFRTTSTENDVKWVIVTNE